MKSNIYVANSDMTKILVPKIIVCVFEEIEHKNNLNMAIKVIGL